MHAPNQNNLWEELLGSHGTNSAALSWQHARAADCLLKFYTDWGWLSTLLPWARAMLCQSAVEWTSYTQPMKPEASLANQWAPWREWKQRKVHVERGRWWGAGIKRWKNSQENMYLPVRNKWNTAEYNCWDTAWTGKLIWKGKVLRLEGERVNEVVWDGLINMLIIKYMGHQRRLKSRLDGLYV